MQEEDAPAMKKSLSEFFFFFFIRQLKGENGRNLSSSE